MRPRAATFGVGQLLFMYASYLCENIKFSGVFSPPGFVLISSSVFFVSSYTLFFHSTFKDLINQGRQKVLEATSALKSVPREPLEDIIAQVVSDGRRAIPYIEAVNRKGYT